MSGTPKFLLQLAVFYLCSQFVCTGDKVVREGALKVHNQHRKNACMQLYSWDDQLEKAATDYSKHLATNEGCKLQHSCRRLPPVTVQESLLPQKDRKPEGYSEILQNSEPRNSFKSKQTNDRPKDGFTSTNSRAYDNSKSGMGENLYWGPSKGAVAEAASAMWYNELKDYHYPGMDNFVGCGDSFGKVGHLTQMMAGRSLKLGCGMHTCPDNKYAVFTCQYLPAGNMQGSALFSENNFLNLCANEQGWKTCISSLQNKCDETAQKKREPPKCELKYPEESNGTVPGNNSLGGDREEKKEVVRISSTTVLLFCASPCNFF